MVNYTSRIGELFNIIVDFPDSTPAVEDLKECLNKTNQHSELVTSLRKAFVPFSFTLQCVSFSERLLHPGANTSDIISQYISTIKTLRIIDSTGLTLDSVSEPVRIYLSGREDTIRCIISATTEDSNSELFEELATGAEERNELGTLDEDDSEDEATDWYPDPIDTQSSKHHTY